MKKVFLMLLCLVFAFLIGCEDKENYAQYPFADIKWERSTEHDTEYIFFSPTGDFSYYCACGNPVNDSDLCEGYSYDEATDTISLNYTEKTAESITKIKLKKCTKDELVLDFGNDIRTFYLNQKPVDADKITYEGELFSAIKFNSDIFNYNLSADGDYSEGEYYKIPHDKWEIVYYNDTLFAKNSDLDEINSYYADDNNYSWWVRVESVENDASHTIDLVLSDTEIDYLYNMEKLEKDETITFEEIKTFATLAKSGKDGLITAEIEIIWHNDAWYWRSGIINESAKGWPEYIFKLPDSISRRIPTVK